MLNWFNSPEMSRQVSLRYCDHMGYSYDKNKGHSTDKEALRDFKVGCKIFDIQPSHYDFMTSYALPQNSAYVMCRLSDRSRWPDNVGCFGLAWMAENNYDFDIESAMIEGQKAIDDLLALRRR